MLRRIVPATLDFSSITVNSQVCRFGKYNIFLIDIFWVSIVNFPIYIPNYIIVIEIIFLKIIKGL